MESQLDGTKFDRHSVLCTDFTAHWSTFVWLPKIKLGECEDYQ